MGRAVSVANWVLGGNLGCTPRDGLPDGLGVRDTEKVFPEETTTG